MTEEKILEAIKNNKLLKHKDRRSIVKIGYIIAIDKNDKFGIFVYKRNNKICHFWSIQKNLNNYSLTEEKVDFSFNDALNYAKNRFSSKECYPNIQFIEEKQPEEDHKGMVQNYNGDWTWGLI